MTQTLEISPKEEERIAELAYEGKRVVIMLAYMNTEGYTASTAFSSWRGIELPETDGYTPYYAVIPVGGYDSGSFRYEIGENAGIDSYFVAEFAADIGGSGFTYNKIVIGIQEPAGGGGWLDPAYPYAVYTETPAIPLAPGQIQTFQVQLVIGGPLS